MNSQLVNTGQGNSLTGIGGNPLAAVLMKNYDLVAGGTINLTPGVTSVVLDSIGSSTKFTSAHCLRPRLIGSCRRIRAMPRVETPRSSVSWPPLRAR